MCSVKSWGLLLIVGCVGLGPKAFAQSAQPAGDQTAPGAPVQLASQDEDARLRSEVANLKAQLQALQADPVKKDTVAADAAPQLAQTGGGGSGDSSASAPATRSDIDALQKQINDLQSKLNKANAGAVGWNGEHFYLRSADGQFQLMPVGYLDAQWADYNQNKYGAPPNSFSITRARFGFQGNYGEQLDYGLTIETISSPTVRDAFLIFKPATEFRLTAGQFKVPFSMEVGTGDTAVDFSNRSIVSVLYPDAAGGNRAPGLEAWGRLGGDTIEYHAGVFNGQGQLASGTTNEPEFVGQLRFSPFKNSGIDLLSGLSFGGSLEHSRAKGLAGEVSFSAAMNDNAYTWFPQFAINGNVVRYNLFASYLAGPLGLRAEYAHLSQDRESIGSLELGGVGFNSEPPVTASGFYISAIYFLTGETDPLNALPRVKHPVIGPASPGESGAPGWGAWALKLRYSEVKGSAPGTTCDATTTPACPITPAITPAFFDNTDQFSFGFNWYLNYWVLAKTDINIDRLKEPSVQGINPRNYVVFLETLQYRF